MKGETTAWLQSAEPDRDAARVLVGNRLYSQAVSYTHLYLEKVLKAVMFERLDIGRTPLTHNLVVLLEGWG